MTSPVALDVAPPSPADPDPMIVTPAVADPVNPPSGAEASPKSSTVTSLTSAKSSPNAAEATPDTTGTTVPDAAATNPPRLDAAVAVVVKLVPSSFPVPSNVEVLRTNAGDGPSRPTSASLSCDVLRMNRVVTVAYLGGDGQRDGEGT